MALHIGILRTDIVRPELQVLHGDYPEMFRNLLDPVATEPIRFSDYNVMQSVPAQIECDAYIITGSKYSVYEDLPWIAPLVEFVNQARARGAKIVGVCFGHQLMAHFFGGKVGPSKNGWAVGVHTSGVVHERPWMQGETAPLPLLSSHQDQVLKLPAGATVYASSDFCPIGGFTLPDVLTIQAHPEFSAAYSRDLMTVRRELLDEATLTEGLKSLSQCTDSRRFARWMLNFMQGDPVEDSVATRS